MKVFIDICMTIMLGCVTMLCITATVVLVSMAYDALKEKFEEKR